MALVLVSLGFMACVEKNCAIEDTECIQQCIEGYCGSESEMNMNELIEYGLCMAEHEDICVDLEK